MFFHPTSLAICSLRYAGWICSATISASLGAQVVTAICLLVATLVADNYSVAITARRLVPSVPVALVVSLLYAGVTFRGTLRELPFFVRLCVFFHVSVLIGRDAARAPVSMIPVMMLQSVALLSCFAGRWFVGDALVKANAFRILLPVSAAALFVGSAVF